MSSIESVLETLGLSSTSENSGCFNGSVWKASGTNLFSISPSSGQKLATIKQASMDDYNSCVSMMESARYKWAEVPMPERGNVVRLIGEALRVKKQSLGSLISIEMGKILSEGLGEVQEFIDVCDMAAGLSRTIAGQVIPSERPGHQILENWSPLGHVGIVTAFNFPCAVLGWNLAISLVCGNTNIWKGASSTSLVTLATARIISDVLQKCNVPDGVFTCVVGSGRTVGESIIQDKRIHLVSFTGSTEVGQHVSETVHKRFGRTILELGGNNATVVMPDANLDLALRASVFGAVGTAGQRCTSLRRLLIHEDIFDSFVARLVSAYKTIRPGDPFEASTLLGPLHTKTAVKEFEDGIAEIKKQGGKILVGGEVAKNLPSALSGGNFVEPTIVEINHDAPIVKTELFVPILYVIKFKTFEEAVQINNSVPQGLSSSLFSNSMQLAFMWMGPTGSDCGIVNVNVGTSGAEIGGAFGGNKETGDGRESGSDSWKQYMRRSTCTVNFSTKLPLAQGVQFDF